MSFISVRVYHYIILHMLVIIQEKQWRNEVEISVGDVNGNGRK